MPIIRKIFKIGSSKAVCLPKDWIEYYEKETGTRIEAVAIEVNRILKIAPLIPKPSKPKESA